MDKPSPTRSPLFPYAVMMITVYGAIAAEVWMIAGGAAWQAMALVLGAIIATALALVRVFGRLLDQGADEPEPVAVPQPAAAPAPAPATLEAVPAEAAAATPAARLPVAA